MKLKILHLTGIFICVLFVNSCGGPYYSTGVRGRSVGFYHSTYGHGWGGGYYDAIDTVDTMDTIDTIDTMDAMDSMGMPDIDF